MGGQSRTLKAIIKLLLSEYFRIRIFKKAVLGF